VNLLNLGLFLLASIVLLGSPGPAIAALLAIGKERGFLGSMRFFWGLQLGLAIGAAVSAAGLFSIIQTLPIAITAMTIAATMYLIWLAYKIATSPVGVPQTKQADGFAVKSKAGFLLGATNPKAYLAFISLMSSYTIIPSHRNADLILKWITCVIVMIVVDLIWLWLGAIVGSANLSPRTERLMNMVMGGTILVTAFLAFV
jgi:threonine/homoserine/homoserine lactone efflux protein